MKRFHTVAATLFLVIAATAVFGRMPCVAADTIHIHRLYCYKVDRNGDQDTSDDRLTFVLFRQRDGSPAVEYSDSSARWSDPEPLEMSVDGKVQRFRNPLFDLTYTPSTNEMHGTFNDTEMTFHCS